MNLIITDCCIPGMTGYDLLKKKKYQINFNLLFSQSSPFGLFTSPIYYFPFLVYGDMQMLSKLNRHYFDSNLFEIGILLIKLV